jgi:hypothetical protein
MRASSPRWWLLGLVALAACGPRVDVHAERSTIATFARYGTYAWATAAAPARFAGETDASILDWRVRDTVDGELAAKGYRRVVGAASLVIDYDVRTRARDAHTFTDFFNYRRTGGSDRVGAAYVEGYEEGTLVVQLVDARTGVLAYRASATGVIQEQPDPGRLEDAVRRMLADLPRAAE